jgi:hypothetical protein
MMPLFLSEVILFGFSISICTKVEPMSKGSDSAPLVMTSLFGAKALVKYRASFASVFDPVTSCFGGTKLLLLLQGTWALPH